MTSISARPGFACAGRRAMADTRRALQRAPWNDACDPLEGVILHAASHALATHGLDEGVEIIAAIVIRDLVTGLDILDRTDLDHVFHEIGFRIRSGRMVD